MAGRSPQPTRSTPSTHSTPQPARGPPLSARAPISEVAAAAAKASPHSARESRTAPRRLERWLDREVQSVSSHVSSDLASGNSAGTSSSSRRLPDLPPFVLFPTDKPSSRADAVVLEKWITSALASYADRAPGSGSLSEDDISTSVEHLVPILSIGLNEVVRQVTQTCSERGIVLEKIWRTYVKLFDRALEESKQSLQKHRHKTVKLERQVSRIHQELSDAHERNPEQIEKLSGTLASKFAERITELEEHLSQLKLENADLKEKLEEHEELVDTWFPRFDMYKASPIAKDLAVTEAGTPTIVTPEAGMAVDFKRILSCIPEERRRKVGFIVSSLLGLRAADMGAETMEALQERRDHNRRKVRQLEQRLSELKKWRASSQTLEHRAPEGLDEASEENGPVAEL
mmetsp:Transcript_41967/g.96344  ORF Transcript_41967/g.96344 Transcript_41967/m.96344 type:complete len:402 (-) Transcript_41967:121-1326(-)